MVSGARELLRVEEGLPGNKKNALITPSVPCIPFFIPVQTILSSLTWELVALQDGYDIAK